jgi:hypothetical protein
MATKTKQSAAGKPNNLAFARSLAFNMQDHRAPIRDYDVRHSHGQGHRTIQPTVRSHNLPPAIVSHDPRPATASSKTRRAANINKSAFVRSLPASLSAAAVIDRGKAKGIRLSAAQVYTIRANARRKGDDDVKVPSGGRSKLRRSGRASEAKEAEFIATALDLGLARAEALIDALRRKAADGWS